MTMIVREKYDRRRAIEREEFEDKIIKRIELVERNGWIEQNLTT